MNSITLLSGLCLTVVILIAGTATLHSQAPPSGQPGGNKPPCKCHWGLTTERMTDIPEGCGDKCAEVVGPTTSEGWRYYTKSVPYSECASGLKLMRQKTSLTLTERFTLQKATITYKWKFYRPADDPSADCSGCPPGQDQVVNVKCGDRKEKCEEQAGDRTEPDTADQPEEMECVSMGT